MNPNVSPAECASGLCTGVRHKNGKSGGSGASFPVVFELAAEPAAAQGDDRVGAAHGPEYSGALSSRGDHLLAAGLDHPRADKQTLTTKLGISHPLRMAFAVVRLVGEPVGGLFVRRGERAQGFPPHLDLASIELVQPPRGPTFPLSLVVGAPLRRPFPKVLPRPPPSPAKAPPINNIRAFQIRFANR